MVCPIRKITFNVSDKDHYQKFVCGVTVSTEETELSDVSTVIASHCYMNKIHPCKVSSNITKSDNSYSTNIIIYDREEYPCDQIISFKCTYQFILPLVVCF